MVEEGRRWTDPGMQNEGNVHPGTKPELSGHCLKPYTHHSLTGGRIRNVVAYTVYTMTVRSYNSRVQPAICPRTKRKPHTTERNYVCTYVGGISTEI